MISTADLIAAAQPVDGRATVPTMTIAAALGLPRRSNATRVRVLRALRLAGIEPARKHTPQQRRRHRVDWRPIVAAAQPTDGRATRTLDEIAAALAAMGIIASTGTISHQLAKVGIAAKHSRKPEGSQP